MISPLIRFRCPLHIKNDLKRRTKNMSKYIVQALEEKFVRDDKKAPLIVDADEISICWPVTGDNDATAAMSLEVCEKGCRHDLAQKKSKNE